MAAPAGLGKRQLRPTGSFEMPKLALPRRGLWPVYALAGALFILAVVFLLGRVRNAEPEDEPNAIWLGDQWTLNTPTDEQYTVLTQRLLDTRIGTIYAWVSLLQPNNAWTNTGQLDNARTFAAELKQRYPQATVLGWLSIAADDAEGNDRLGDPTTRQNIADFAGRVAGDLGFDGVFLNVVPVGKNDEDYLALLRQVRLTLGEDTLLAVAVPPDWTPDVEGIPVPAQIAPGTFWDEAFKQRVALLVDQIFVANYNSGFTSAADYTAWVAYQVQAYAEALDSLDVRTELIMGVPTYDTVLPDHDAAVENAVTAIQGIRDGQTLAGPAARVLRGIGLYAEWETTEEEWNQVRELWVGP
jgi:trans-aconitate methyltransferase